MIMYYSWKISFAVNFNGKNKPSISNVNKLFLKDKTRKMDFTLENAKLDFQRFWKVIGAEGDIEAALSEFNTFYNASGERSNTTKKAPFLPRLLQKLKRLVSQLPNFVRYT